MSKGVTVLGVPIDDVSMDEALSTIDGFIQERSFHQIATANVDFLVHAIENWEYKQNLCRCDLVVADGMPVVLASYLLGAPLRERVAGSDMVPLLAQRKYRFFLLGAKPEVSLVAAQRLTQMGAQIVGRISPPVGPQCFDNDFILAEIEKADPDILLVALGSPKQELWIHQHRTRLKVPVCMGVGGALDFLAGAVSRAPACMRRSGLEWVYRIWAEPRRLAGRYLKDAFCLARYLTVQLAVNAVMRRTAPGLELGVESIGSVRVLTPSGPMTGFGLSQFEQTALAATRRGEELIVDLTSVSYLGADGFRVLTGLFRAVSNNGRQVWLVGVNPELSRLMKASHCDRLFKRVPTVIDGVRQASRGRLQLSLELGEGWAVCRLVGDVPPGASGTVERICRQISEANEFFQLDGSGAPGFDVSGLPERGRPSTATATV